MTIREVNEMRSKGFNNFEKEKLFDAYTIVNATKNTFTELEKDIKENLESKMNVGDQLTLDFGSNIFTSSMVNVDDISFDCSDEDLYKCAQACADMYCTHAVNKAEMKKDYKRGTLHPDLIKHIKITTQSTMKITKKAKKEEE